MYRPIALASSDPQYGGALFLYEKWRDLIRGDFDAASGGVPMAVSEPVYASFGYSLAAHAALWLRDLTRAVHIQSELSQLTVRGRSVATPRAGRWWLGSQRWRGTRRRPLQALPRRPICCATGCRSTLRCA